MRKMSPGYKHLKRRRACFNLKCKWMGQKYHKNNISIFYNPSESLRVAKQTVEDIRFVNVNCIHVHAEIKLYFNS